MSFLPGFTSAAPRLPGRSSLLADQPSPPSSPKGRSARLLFGDGGGADEDAENRAILKSTGHVHKIGEFLQTVAHAVVPGMSTFNLITGRRGPGRSDHPDTVKHNALNADRLQTSMNRQEGVAAGPSTPARKNLAKPARKARVIQGQARPQRGDNNHGGGNRGTSGRGGSGAIDSSNSRGGSRPF